MDGCPDTIYAPNPDPVPKENGIWGKIINLYQKRYPYYDQLHIDVASSLIRDKLCEKTFGEDGKLYYDPCFATDLNGKTTGIGAGLLNKIPYQKLRVELYTDNYSQLLDTQYFIWKGFPGEPSPQPDATPQPKPNTSFNSCSEFATRSLIGDEQIVVTTDKESYNDGDTVVISGQVRDLLSGTPVSLQVIAANGNAVSILQIDVGTDHKFCTEISAGGGLWKSKGTYTVKVLYGTQSRTAETTFEFGGSDGTTPKPTGTIGVDRTNFVLSYKITGGNVLSVTPDDEAKSLVIAIKTTSDGVLTITLPRALIDAKINGQDDNFFVLIDGEEVEFEETATGTDRTLTIAFPDGAEEIEIIGTFVVPEFGTIAALILAIAIISIIALSAKTRLSILPKY